MSTVWKELVENFAGTEHYEMLKDAKFVHSYANSPNVFLMTYKFNFVQQCQLHELG